MKMLKDAVVAVLVVGSFVTGAVGLANAATGPWPQTQDMATAPVAASAPASARADDQLVAVTYVIRADCPQP